MKKKIAILACGWSTYFVQDFIKGVQSVAKENNTDVYVFNAYNFTEYSGFPNYTGFSIFSLINYEEYDGAIILGDLIGNPRVLEKERLRILKAGKPAICINHQIQGLNYLKVDNYTGLYEVMNHLIKDHGITDFGFIRGRETSIDLAERYKAYREALANNNIKIDADKTYSITACNFEHAYPFFKELVKEGKPLPQVMVCANDLIAIAIIKAAEECNIKIPEDLKVVGYDDIDVARNVVPALTTVKNDAELAGSEAIKQLLGLSPKSEVLNIKSKAIIRHSCRCKIELGSTQKEFTLGVVSSMNKNEEFGTQMEVIEEIFTEATDVFTLLTNIESFFAKNHTFEGENFCVFLKSDWASVLINSEERLPQNLSYGNQVQSIVSVQNNKKYTNEVISTKSIVPSKMISEEGSDTFLIMPIFNHSYVFGYIVTKNSTALIENHYGYTWTKTFGNSIEHFRKRNMFKQMSQQYLKLSTHDALSGMMNRIGMERLAIPFYQQNKNNNLTSVLFFIDINKMKLINDQFGHLHGDLAVKTVAAAVMQVVPKNWMCIRYGGDEFLVVGNSRNYNGEDYCTQIVQCLQKKVAVMRLPYPLTCSVGTYQVPPNSDLTLEQAVQKVDAIMYIKKQQFHKELGDR